MFRFNPSRITLVGKGTMAVAALKEYVLSHAFTLDARGDLDLDSIEKI